MKESTWKESEERRRKWKVDRKDKIEKGETQEQIKVIEAVVFIHYTSK